MLGWGTPAGIQPYGKAVAFRSCLLTSTLDAWAERHRPRCTAAVTSLPAPMAGDDFLAAISGTPPSMPPTIGAVVTAPAPLPHEVAAGENRFQARGTGGGSAPSRGGDCAP